MKRPVAIIIRDGWALNPNKEGNAVAAANTPNCDAFKKTYPWTTLDCCGEPVGLPHGYMGSSEVGHLNMGAGRIVIQELKRIDDELKAGVFFEAPMWKTLIDNWKSNQSQFHLLGLLQNEGVHGHQDHLFQIMHRARGEYADGKIVLHLFTDGRDSAPRSVLEYMITLREAIKEVGGPCTVSTVMGRYYSMDRSRNWKLTDQAYHTIVDGVGNKVTDAESAIQHSYDNDKTPDGDAMFDEYIPAQVMEGYAGMQDGDSVLHTNYRQDRAIQLTKAFVDPAYAGDLKRKPKIVFGGLTRYYNEFENFIIAPMESGGGMNHLLGEVVSNAGMRQLRIAETQKFPHVTSFFNGKSTTPFEGEDQVDLPSRFDPSSFGSHPEMEAYNLTDEILRRLEDNPYEFIVVNYANGDMVGHTGNLEAAKKSIEIVDECVGKIVARLLELDAQVLVTADHGNADQMIDYDTGRVKTSHSLFPVECIYVANDAPGRKLVDHGKLSDIAPTALELLGLPIPAEMTATSLLAK